MARRLFTTAHKLLLDMSAGAKLRGLTGRVLIVGSGMEHYAEGLPLVSHIVTTDIIPTPGISSLADAHKLPFPDCTFDSYVAMEVLEHLKSPEEAATEIWRVLKPNGTAIISIPFLFRVHGDPDDFQRLTKSGLMELFQRFSSIEITAFGNRLHVISDLLTTATRYFVGFRLMNHIFRIKLLNIPSQDAPSGYIIKLTK